jgi:hypothetical protein
MPKLNALGDAGWELTAVKAISGHFAYLVEISGDTGDRVTVHVETTDETRKTIAHLIHHGAAAQKKMGG